jgi:hypothetical protein
MEIIARLYSGFRVLDVDPPEIDLNLSDADLYETVCAHMVNQWGSVVGKSGFVDMMKECQFFSRRPDSVIMVGRGWIVSIKLEKKFQLMQKIA